MVMVTIKTGICNGRNRHVTARCRIIMHGVDGPTVLLQVGAPD